MTTYMSKDKNQKVTPLGVAKFPKIIEPDYTWKEEGEYSVKLVVGKEEAKQFKAWFDEEIKRLYKETCAEQKKKKLKMGSIGVRNEEDEDGNPTGNLEIVAKQKAKHTRKSDGKVFEFKPAIFDAAGKPITEDIRPWTGSKMKLCVEPKASYVAATGFHASLRLKAVQVIEVVESSGPTAASFGFEEEQGFSQDQAEGSAGSPFDEEETSGEEQTGQEEVSAEGEEDSDAEEGPELPF